MMLKDKVAVVYGAGGAIGGAVASAFAAAGANVFPTGPHLAAQVDALDERDRRRPFAGPSSKRLAA